MSQNFIARKTRLAGGVDLEKSFVVTIDETFDSVMNRVKSSAGAFCLTNAVLFPTGVDGIDSIDVRKAWKPGQKIIMNWPKKGGGLNLVETKVYDLFPTKRAADQACERLTAQLDQESRDASATGAQDDGQEKEIFSDNEEQRDESNNSSESISIRADRGNDFVLSSAAQSTLASPPLDFAMNPPSKRMRRSTAATSPQTELATTVVQLTSIIQSMESRLGAKLDILIGKVDQLQAENLHLKSTLNEIKGGVKTSARRSKEACNLLEGKDSVYREPIGASDCGFLFDPETEGLLYMNIDITEEINTLFIESGSDQKEFAKGLGKKLYGDDLWFWMITSSEGSKPGQRKSLAKRDPAGLLLIDKILRHYFDKVFWPRHPAYLEKMAGSADKSQVLIDRELAPKKVSAYRVFHLNSITAINDWGNDCRKREKNKYDWKNSLFGQFVRRDESEKPPGYDAEKEEQWRLKCYGEKSCAKRATAVDPSVS